MLPLEGITVVSLEQAVAAPFATRQLADLGARVIKVERPEVGDFARGYDTTVKGLSSHFVWLNRSKESLTLNLKEEGAKEILSMLIEKGDVFIQNLAPGAAGRLGFGVEILRERHPRLIVCDVSGYGTSGPYRNKKPTISWCNARPDSSPSPAHPRFPPRSAYPSRTSPAVCMPTPAS